jgi:uncharacterized protein (TIGR02996 family)
VAGVLTPRHPDLEVAIEARLWDPAPRLAYADWLEERGEYNLAVAHRWLAEQKKFPNRETWWSWVCPIWSFTHERNSGSHYSTHTLPLPLFHRLQELTPAGGEFWREESLEQTHCFGPYWCSYRTPQLAVEYLGRALQL